MKEISLEKVRGIIARIDNAEYNKEWREFTQTYYGPSAHSVKIDVDAEYNDEGYSANISDMTVYDISGKLLKPDPTLPVFEEAITDYRKRNYEKLKSGFKKQFPVLDEGSWDKMANAEIEKQTDNIIDSEMSDAKYNLDFPNSGDVGDSYSNSHIFYVADDKLEVPTFYIDDDPETLF